MKNEDRENKIIIKLSSYEFEVMCRLLEKKIKGIIWVVKNKPIEEIAKANILKENVKYKSLLQTINHNMHRDLMETIKDEAN